MLQKVCKTQLFTNKKPNQNDKIIYFDVNEAKHSPAAQDMCCRSTQLASVAVSLEVEPQLKDIIVEMAAEAAFVGVFPLAVDDLECDVLIRWACVETKYGKVLVLGTSFLK